MIIDQHTLDYLTAQAKESPRLRMNLDLRNSPDDQSQRMLNAIEPGTVLPIHRHRDTSETVVCLRGHFEEYLYDGEGLFYSPIITGLKKTDKICFLPHSYYHAYLAKRIIDNPSLLICGYSFGDLYVNQLLQRHKLIHDQNERVVIVDRWSDFANVDNVSLYRYFMDKTSGGLREFVMRLTESGSDTLEAFTKFKQVSDGCWESPNGALLLYTYTKGLKYAVESHTQQIIDFLL